MLRIFDSEALRRASGDVFGRIYEYFLMKFAIQGAQDNGEFFTPPSLVQMIVNVIEPDQGVVADLACGSGGMFVQTSHFMEDHGQRTMDRVTFYGQEKTATTIRLAKMNLAVHGLEGEIMEANTFYQDDHRLSDGRPLWGNCDFMMANPPFNVDMVDEAKVKGDRRLPFGLPGVNKSKTISNANYLWISYFHSYLNAKGRAGFVMSSQASSAGHGEAEVRQKLVATGDVDVMMSIRSNFFYTRSVPCELWFLDRGKPTAPSPPTPLPAGEGSQKSHYRGGYEFSGLVDRARELRQKQTPAEDVLWQLLRNRQLAEMKFRRQHQIGDYITDFYCAEHKLVVELDGSAHEDPKQAKKDTTRQKYLESVGNTVLRFRNEEVLTAPDAVLEKIIASALPSPPGRRAGDEGKSCATPLNEKGNVLMLDARNIYRKVTRKIYDFSAEQQQNLSAIVWLYRGQNERFIELVGQHVDRSLQAAHACFRDENAADGPYEPLDAFREAVKALHQQMNGYLETLPEKGEHDLPIGDYLESKSNAEDGIEAFRLFTSDAQKHRNECGEAWSDTKDFIEHILAPQAERSRSLASGLDALCKHAAQLISQGEADSRSSESDLWNSREIKKTFKAADAARLQAVENLKHVAYFHRQALWLLHRFPEARYVDVPGLCKIASRADIAAADWSLTPGRYVGVAPAEVDEDFDFGQAMRDIHVELKDLDREASELAAKIQANFEGLGI
jgi:type I restriction-modification system DNA methylase subunit